MEKIKFFKNFKEYGQALDVTIRQHDMLRRVRRSSGMTRTHVHPEEEGPKRKLQAKLLQKLRTQEGERVDLFELSDT